ncbi:phenylacetic acid degradation bifunctional protein PaaZ [Chromatiales bacterium (ex Bugula neritina AB1)]|nr:phenylacetic acid degradation bifunctional protein PaaZ [Chromatiales bacterium (ex Bugula neritina AB1)]
MNVDSYVAGHWVTPDDSAVAIPSAVTGKTIARAGNASLDTLTMLDYARNTGGAALREMTFHDRARALKNLATYLNEHKESLVTLAFDTGATRADSFIDIDGGIGTVFVFASKGRRELPDDTICSDGDIEQLSRNGSFLGQHIYTSKPGVAVHINAYNFPVWGMLEKLAPTLLAGMPAIIKPATSTCYVTMACFRLMLQSEAFPPGSMQLISGSTGELLNQLNFQDSVSFTGSARTALMLKSTRRLLEHSIPFTAEQDSLNATVIGPDVVAGSAEFDLAVREICTEMTTKAGQKCTAIRRIMAPLNTIENFIEAIREQLSATRIGNPALESNTMGALVSTTQRDDVFKAKAALQQQTRTVYENPNPEINGADSDHGAFMSPVLLHCEHPDNADAVHSTEAFGPLSTIMPYRDLSHACKLLNHGRGSLVASVITCDPDVARDVTLASASSHGRLYFNNRHSMRESTGHGSPLPHLTHGGPGRAGGGEELGGVRAVKHYMQRTALQGHPDLLSAATSQYIIGSTETTTDTHPFRKRFSELFIGETLSAGPREITLDDIEHFARFTGDTFYAHMDEEAARDNPFFPGRVAHGYLLLSFAAGLFVDPDPGPVLANTGLDGLTFQKPVSPEDSINVSLIVKRKTKRNDEYGEVRWHVRLENQHGEQVASYELHTMNLL